MLRWLPSFRLVAVHALACCALVALAACSRGTSTAAAPATATPSASATASTFPFTATDSAGQSFTLATPAKAIVSHSPGVTEILFAIGAGGQIVAVDDFSDFPAAAKPLQRVKYSNPSAEAEIALAPDLVFLTGNQRAQVEGFRRLRVPVFYNEEPSSLEGVLANVRLLGRMTGHTPEAEALVAKMQARIDAVTAKLKDVPQGPKAFYELSDSLYTASPNTFVGAMLTVLKVRNVAQGATTAFPQLSSEAVIAAAPDAILLADAKFGGSPAKVKARPGWSAIPAVQNDRLYAVDGDLVNRPGPRIVEGVELMAKLLYPERFP